LERVTDFEELDQKVLLIRVYSDQEIARFNATVLKKVSDMEIVKDAIGHLGDIEGLYRKKASSDASEANLLIDKIQRIAENLEQKEPELIKFQEQKAKLKEEEDKLLEVLSNHPEAAIKEQEKNLEEAKRIIEISKSRVEDNREKQRSFIMRYFTKLFLIKPIKSALEVLQEAEDKGITPPPIESYFLEEKLKA